MASLIWDVAQDKLERIHTLRNFLYENGKPLVKKGLPGTYKSHTEEEYRKILDEILNSELESYKTISHELGWDA